MTPTAPTKHANQTFVTATLELDGAEFVNCKFLRCAFIYRGGELPSFEHCEFDMVSVKFRDCALNALHMLKTMFNNGMSDMVMQVVREITSP